MVETLLGNATMTLFFTGGISLKTWIDVGNIDRELEIYKRISGKMSRVNFVSYGGWSDRKYMKNLGDINLLSVKWHKKEIFTIYNLILKYYSEIKKTDVLKTNQIIGSEIPIWFKDKFKKKLIIRCGYLYSYFLKNQTKDEKKINYAIRLEKNAFKKADIGIVTSSWQRDFILEQYDIELEKIKVIPNYVITDIFKPNTEVKKRYDLIFVGRAGSQKNLINLMNALKYIKSKNKSISLILIGGCCLDNQIKEIVFSNNLDVTFKDNVQNFELPDFLNQAKVFILPSLYEGHPKVLLEAMSCGLPCIGTDVVGIREDIENMENGYLCETDYKSIANAIETVLANELLQEKIGKNARKYILKRYSIEKILKMELDIISELLSK